MALQIAVRRAAAAFRAPAVLVRAASAGGPTVRDVISARDAQLREEHYALPEEVPAHSFDGDVDINREELFRKRLIYRAKQRGWLEVDLILGSWANLEVPSLSSEELGQFDEVLKLETVDVYNFITGKDTVPEALNSPVMQRIMAYAKSAPVGHASPAGYVKVKAGMSN